MTPAASNPSGGRASVAHDPSLARGGPGAWRAVDLITLAIVGVALGVAFWGWDNSLYQVLNVASKAFPPSGELLLGVWLLPAVVGALIVRRPGAALLTELVAAAVENLLGNQWGTGVLISGLLQAAGVELAVALFAWRRWKPSVAMLGGALSAVFAIVLYEWWTYVAEYGWDWKVVYLACGVISGIVITGLGGWALVQALARAGALSAFPPGHELLAARALDRARGRDRDCA